jgi:geranylgeranyl diphosphate synthase type II
VTTGLVIDHDVVEATLAADRARTAAASSRWLRSTDPELGALVADYPGRGGKGLRPALCLSTCRAFGGESADALGSAVAIELLHNAFLVHDDICDDARTRRGRPALHVEHGVPMALLAGDALAWSALDPLLANVEALGTRLALEVLSEFRHLTARTIDGQAAELAWRRDLAALDVDSYLAVVLDKTCWYTTIHPCRVGALIGSRGSADLDAVARYAFFVGALFQVLDDLDDVDDILEGKPTLALAHLLGTAPPEVRDEVLGLVGPGSPGDGDRPPPAERIALVQEQLDRHGSLAYARDFADGLAGAALVEHEAAVGHLPPSDDVTFLRSLVLHLRR